eukprot:GFYU01008202.1.p1 GENE.GFYU01008202.1~~GFYU01008202.1.p1  ORF type:complete len:533 (-),score=94.07 GFYU01008202.1:39-1637(-)
MLPLQSQPWRWRCKVPCSVFTFALVFLGFHTPEQCSAEFTPWCDMGEAASRNPRRVVDWLNENGVDTSNVQVEQCHGKGGCLIARRSLRHGSTILQIPPHLTIDKMEQDRLDACQKFQMVVKTVAMELHPAIVGEFMLAVYLMVERTNGDNPFAPYLATLPLKPMSYLTMDATQVEYMVQQSKAVYDHYKTLDNLVMYRWHRLELAMLDMYPDVFTSEIVSPDNFRWAMSIVRTRSFEDVDGYRRLIPLVDMANHSILGSPRVVGNDNSVRAGVNLSPSDEITFNYGHYDNMELFLLYGFTDFNDRNIFDKVDLKIPLERFKGRSYTMLVEHAAIFENEVIGRYIPAALYRYTVDWMLVQLARVMAADMKDMGRYNFMNRNETTIMKHKGFISEQNDSEAVHAMRIIVNSMYTIYPNRQRVEELKGSVQSCFERRFVTVCAQHLSILEHNRMAMRANHYIEAFEKAINDHNLSEDLDVKLHEEREMTPLEIYDAMDELDLLRPSEYGLWMTDGDGDISGSPQFGTFQARDEL